MRSLICLSLVLLVLFGCAANKPAVNPATSDSAVAESPRDSLRAKFQLTIVNADGSKQEFDAVLFSVPGKRYRMELTGPLGIGVASMLWTEGGWQMTFPTEKLYVKGVGYMVGLLNDRTLPLVHIHQVADLFDGRLLPGKSEYVELVADSVPESMRVEGAAYGRENSGRVFSYAREPAGGESPEKAHVSWLSRMGRDGKLETLRFYDFKVFEGVETPSKVVFELGGKMFLEIRIKKVARNKPFSSGTWRLNIPKSFKQVGE